MPKKQKAPEQPRITEDIPIVFNPTVAVPQFYADFFNIAGSAHTFALYFGCLAWLNEPEPAAFKTVRRVDGVIRISPTVAKELQNCLTISIEKYESRFGPIVVPKRESPLESRPAAKGD